MQVKTGYPNTVAMSEDAMLAATTEDYIDVYNSRSNRHMAHIPKDLIPQFLKSGTLKTPRTTTGFTETFWRCIIPKECEIAIK